MEDAITNLSKIRTQGYDEVARTLVSGSPRVVDEKVVKIGGRRDKGGPSPYTAYHPVWTALSRTVAPVSIIIARGLYSATGH